VTKKPVLGDMDKKKEDIRYRGEEQNPPRSRKSRFGVGNSEGGGGKTLATSCSIGKRSRDRAKSKTKVSSKTIERAHKTQRGGGEEEKNVKG